MPCCGKGFYKSPSEKRVGVIPSAMINAQEAQLVIIDVQDRLMPAMADHKSVIAHLSTIVKSVAQLQIPMTLTEQYPVGLGSTVEEVRASLPDRVEIVEKKSFSALGSKRFLSAILKHDCRQLLIVGCEAHVCVLQTAIDAKNAGYEPFCVWSAITSRHSVDKEAAKSRLLAQGITIVTTEMAVFELLKSSEHKDFRTLSRLIRDL